MVSSLLGPGTDVGWHSSSPTTTWTHVLGRGLCQLVLRSVFVTDISCTWKLLSRIKIYLKLSEKNYTNITFSVLFR